MTIFQKITLQSLKKSRTRTLVTIIGVILSTAMVTAVATFAVSLQNYLVNGAIAKYGDWHVAFTNTSDTLLPDQISDARVDHAAVYDNVGYAQLTDGKNPAKPYLFIAGMQNDALTSLPIDLISGRLPQNDSEVLVPAHLAANGGVKLAIGDTFTTLLGTRSALGQTLNQHDPYCQGQETLVPETEKTYTVVGICQRPSFEEFSAPGYTLITTADPSRPAASQSLFVTLHDAKDAKSYAASLSGSSPYVFNDNVLRFYGLSGDQLFNTMLYAIGAILILLIMIGSVLLIYNAFTISLGERTQQFGILMSVGATEKQLRHAVVFEGLVIGLIGIPLGILVGIPSVQLVILLVAKNFSNVMYDNVPLTLSVSLPALLNAAAVSLLTILISAYIPAKKAASVPIMTCIRQNDTIKVDAKAVRTSPRIERLCGLEGTLAVKNFQRNKRRYRSIILSLALSVILFVSASVFGAALDQITQHSTVQMDGDIAFYTQEMTEDDFFQLADQLQTAPGVTKSTYQTLLTYTCPVPVQSLTPQAQAALEVSDAADILPLTMDIQFIEPVIYDNFLREQGLALADYTGDDPQMIVVGKLPGNFDIFTDRSLDLSISAGEAAKTLHAQCVDTYPLDPTPSDTLPKNYVLIAVAPYPLKAQFADLPAPTRMGLTFWSDTPKQTTSAMQTILDGQAITAHYQLYDLHRILEENRNLSFIVDLFTVVFISMISLIAIANVFNTISTNIKLRRRELAMLRSIGMNDRDFGRMMRFECVLYGTRTLLYGLPISLILSYLIYRGMTAGGADITYSLPLASMAASTLGVFLIIFITMLYTTSKLRQENIIDALRDNMT